MSTVLMRHPTLPSEQEIEVDEGAVPHYAHAGWQRVPGAELEARAAAAAKALEAAAEVEVEPAAPPAKKTTAKKPATQEGGSD